MKNNEKFLAKMIKFLFPIYLPYEYYAQYFHIKTL